MSGSAVGFEAFDPLKTKASEELSGRNQDGQTRYEEFEKSSDNQGFENERRPLRHIDTFCKPECPCLSKRYTIAVLACVGFIISFGMRCNMGMARLHSVDHENTTLTMWSTTQSFADSSFFWGYLFTQVPGGFLAWFFPANRIFGVAIVASSFLNLLAPSAISYSPVVLIIIQFCKGLVEGVTYPACHGIWTFWAPPAERSRLATLTFSGAFAGIVIGMPLSGALTMSFGWTASFYFYGVCGIIWFGFWLWLSCEKPSRHPSISTRELHYIEDSLGQPQAPTFMTIPWFKLITSMPVYAIVVANFCRSWNFYLLVLYQARFMHEAFSMSVMETGLLGALPHFLMTLVVPFGGLLADYLRASGRMTTTNVRKLFSCGGFGMEALLFLVVGLCAHTQNGAAATLALTIAVVFRAFAISGYNVNHLDIAPRYASILMGVSGFFGTTAGVIVPLAVDFINENRDGSSWRNVFVMAALVHFVGAAFYGVFCSGEPQPWAEGKKRWNTLDDSHDKREALRIVDAEGRMDNKNVHV